jgi:hypothetical protein
MKWQLVTAVLLVHILANCDCLRMRCTTKSSRLVEVCTNLSSCMFVHLDCKTVRLSLAVSSSECNNGHLLLRLSCVFSQRVSLLAV